MKIGGKLAVGAFLLLFFQGQVAHAMLYTLRLLTATQKVTNMDAGGRKLLTGFCLQALEISRHRTTAASNTITQLEQDWLLKLETHVCDYLQTTASSDAFDAVVMYVNAISSAGTNFYIARSGAYPLVLLEMLCHLCIKNESLKTSKGRELVKICSEVLLNSSACLEAVALPELRAFDLLLEGTLFYCFYWCTAIAYVNCSLPELISAFIRQGWQFRSTVTHC